VNTDNNSVSYSLSFRLILCKILVKDLLRRSKRHLLYCLSYASPILNNLVTYQISVESTNTVQSKHISIE
jgi:hypothetical protein